MAGGIKVRILDDEQAVAGLTAQFIVELLRRRPDAVLGLATGSTPEPTYDELVRLYCEGGLSFSKVRTVNLDEYLGLDGDHEQSFRFFMQKHLFGHLDIRPWNTFIFDGMAREPEQECLAFEAKIRGLGGVDLWLLGLGGNGHSAFNEPGSAAGSRSRVVTPNPETVEANSRHFADPREVPRRGLTVGVGTILAGRSIVLLATGAHKAEAVAQAVEGPCSVDCPASLLQDHPDCFFLLDRPAAARLS